jgi:hypothetical protein
MWILTASLLNLPSALAEPLPPVFLLLSYFNLSSVAGRRAWRMYPRDMPKSRIDDLNPEQPHPSALKTSANHANS